MPTDCTPHTTLTHKSKSLSKEEYQDAAKELLGRALRNAKKKDSLRVEFESVYGTETPSWKYEDPQTLQWAFFPEQAGKLLEGAWQEGSESVVVLDALGEQHRVTFRTMQFLTSTGIKGQVQRQVECVRPSELTPREAKLHAILHLRTPDLADFMMME